MDAINLRFSNLGGEAIVPLKRKGLYIKADEWLEVRNYQYEAIQACILGGDLCEATKLIVNVHQKLISEEKWKSLERYLDLCTLEQLMSSVELMIIKGWVYTMLGNREKLMGVISAIDDNKDYFPIESDVFRGEYYLLKSILNLHVFNRTISLKYAIKALGVLPDNAVFFKGWAQAQKISSYILNGDFTRGLDSLKVSHSNLIARDPQYQSKLFYTEAMGYLYKNDLDNLLLNGKKLNQLAIKHNLTENTSSSSFLLLMYYFSKNEFAEAKEVYTKLTENNDLLHRSILLQATYIRSLIFQHEGDFAKSKEIIENIYFVLSTENNHQLITTCKIFINDIMYRAGEMVNTNLFEEKFDNMTPYILNDFTLPHIIMVKLLISHGDTKKLNTASKLLEFIKSWVIKFGVDRLKIDVLILEGYYLYRVGEIVLAKQKIGQAIKLAHHAGNYQAVLNYRNEIAPVLGTFMNREYFDEGSLTEMYKVTDRSNPLIDNGEKDRAKLTNRELDILELMSLRFSNKEIGLKLFIEPNSVKRHTIRIYKKLEVNSRQEAVSRAYSNMAV